MTKERIIISDETKMEALNAMDNIFQHLDADEARKMYLGLVEMVIYRGKPVDQMSYWGAVQALRMRGRITTVTMDSLNNYFGEAAISEKLNELVIRELHSDQIEDLTRFGNFPRNGKVGLMHGHYRMLTLAHMLNFIEARRQCDYLVVLIESNERSKIFKGKEPLIHDANRLKSLIIPGFADQVGLLRGYLYNNDYYAQLVKATKPDIYFISEAAPDIRKQEHRQVAESINASLVVLPYYKGISTSLIEQLH
jgi:bifunctional ADP-heptose synthase (sugar kinase/adenylyltransferase)